jgi:hypothetical protein
MQESQLLHDLDVLHEEPRAALSSASSSSSGVRSAPTRAYKHQLNLVRILYWHQVHYLHWQHYQTMCLLPGHAWSLC